MRWQFQVSVSLMRASPMCRKPIIHVKRNHMLINNGSALMCGLVISTIFFWPILTTDATKLWNVTYFSRTDIKRNADHTNAQIKDALKKNFVSPFLCCFPCSRITASLTIIPSCTKYYCYNVLYLPLKFIEWIRDHPVYTMCYKKMHVYDP